MNARQPTRGFTLVELMVVIAIIGLLMTLIVPAVTKATQMLLTARTERMLHDIGMGLDAFYADFKCYPPSKPAEAKYSEMTSGAANLALCLRGPVGRGWGTTAGGLMPFGGRAQRAYGPYYSTEESLIAYDADGVLAGFLDPLEPSGLNLDDKIVGRILYFRTSADGTVAWTDNPDPTESDPTKQAFMGYVSGNQVVSGGAKRYLLVSPGFDRRYGPVYESDDGVVPDADGTAEGATCDDIRYAR